MNHEQLIELVCNYPVLYDLSNPKYMDTDFKNKILSKIGEELKTTAALAFLIVGTLATWPSPTYSKLKESLDTEVTPGQWAWAISLFGVGVFITPLPTKYLMNKFGRKCLLLASVPFFFLSWLLIIFATLVERKRRPNGHSSITINNSK